MKSKRSNILIIIIVILIVGGLAAALIFGGKIKMNPPGTIGNTAGNLNNGGIFCEYNGKVYFSNPYDGGSLYSMTLDEGGLDKLNDVSVTNILAGGEYLYYYRIGESGDAGLGSVRSLKSFNRCLLNGRDAVGLSRDTVVRAQLVDNYLYMLSTTDARPMLRKLKIDKSEEVVLADYEINPACAENGTIYYNGTQNDHYLYGLNTATDASREIWQGNLWYPVKQGDYIYYMDVDNNYRLCRYSLSMNVVEVLTDDRVDCFNVGNGYIYYQKNDSAPSLNCMHTDGSNVQVIAEGNYTNINMTSKYVYFREFGNDTAIYHSPLGSGTYNDFQAAKRAVQ